ncbi:hypothetical protein [uncultured Rikenella sp.]|uniref:hypothetical protein n=1 Tax=uncultured Rikenella sp. TaxID=368003 RepID=UPI0025FC8D62|nr:hypothetical protein [uncultured Rikenella sp.]
MFRKGLVSLQPAPGCRYRDTGALFDVGKGGYNWSSTVSSTNSMYLDFGMAWFSPGGTHNRVLGFQLRCLSE